MSLLRQLLLAVVMAVVLEGPLSNVAAAHPHVWVKVETKVLYEKGTIIGFSHRWTFDDLYTAMAIEGLDANKDGTYDRKELAELAQVNMDGLKEFEYFTFPKLGASPIALGEPRDFWLEHADGVLTLNFVLPLAEPVLAEAEGFSFTVTDPSFFIAFDLAEKNPVVLGEGAPGNCAVKIAAPKNGADDVQRLGEAFSTQLAAGLGISISSTVNVVCPKS